MVSVDYELQIPYIEHAGRHIPGIVVELQNPTDPDQRVELLAELDSGAEYSLFRGSLAPVLGLELLAGSVFKFNATNRSSIEARVHPLIIAHPELGRFRMELRFSVQDISRDLLGRDFFDLVQIGFREHHRLVFLTPRP